MFDAIILGGGPAGLQAALTLGRSVRRVAVIDAGAPRNRFAAHSHNLFTRDGVSPSELLRLARADLAAYDVTFFEERAVEAAQHGDFFRVTLASGASLDGLGVIVATGQRDLLPPLPGLAEVWGDRAFFCPVCHGWEHRGAPMAILDRGPYALHMAPMLLAWTPAVHVLADGPLTDELAALRARGIQVHEAGARAITAGPTGLQLTLSDGGTLDVAAALIKPPTEPVSDLAARLGVPTHDGLAVTTAPMFATAVPGVFVVGDAAVPMPTLVTAIHSGLMAAVGMIAHLNGRHSEPHRV